MSKETPHHKSKAGDATPSARSSSPPNPQSEHRSKDPRLIVGIGASAGGLAALKDFFSRIGEDTGLTFVVIVHLAPEHKSHMAELLQTHIKMPVQQVTETVPLERNQVYVIPPNANLDTIDTHLRLRKLEENRRERAPIDHFFRTLAKTHDIDAVGIILTGTGSDGTLGIKEIKERGGLTIVQDPAEAEYDGMPQSAIATGVVDLVLPLAEIPDALTRFVQTRPNLPRTLQGDTPEKQTEDLLQKVFAQLRARTGRDFAHYKRSTSLRRIQRRMQIRQTEELAAYVDLLRADPKETRLLADDLLITVTSFFRDPKVFRLLEKRVIPKLFDSKKRDEDIRVWSVGCATGEEAYSIAMLLAEEADRRDSSNRLQVFASDLHDDSLKHARDGFYTGDIETAVSAERLKRFFVQDNGGYRISQELRDLVVFAPHNILADPPFSRIDLLSCRNLLIYIQRAAQQGILELFHYALRPGGCLVLGASETVDPSELFSIEDKKCCVHRKRDVPVRESRLPAFSDSSRATPRKEESNRERYPPIVYQDLHSQLAERMAPPGALVGPDDKVAHLSDDLGDFLTHPRGEPTTNIIKLVKEEFRMELRTTLKSARQSGELQLSNPVPFRSRGKSAVVVIRVLPAPGPQQAGFALVAFDLRDTLPVKPKRRRDEPQVEGENGVRARESDLELDLARQRLQSLVEEYEKSQEEMNASNEELQSANEELRATMEELETSKEELQSMNEELQTVNQENRHKVEELGLLSSDLQNLLAATDIATLFLDRKLAILRFTPKVGKLFNVRPSDRGRPLSDLTHRLGYDRLHEDAQKVLDELAPIEREVEDVSGRWYLTRVMPYRSEEDRIEGVVITLVEITRRKQDEIEIRNSREYAEHIVESLPEPLLVLTDDLKVRSANVSFYQHFKVEPEKTTGRKIYDLGNGQWDIPALRDLLENILPENNVFDGFEVEHEFEDLGRRFMLLNARRLDHQQLILLGIQDITDRRHAEDALRESDKRFRTLIEQIQDYAIFMLDTKLRGSTWNEGVRRVLGFEEEEFIGIDVSSTIFTKEDVAKDVPEKEMKEAAKTGSGRNDRWMRRKDGSTFWASGITSVLRNSDGELVGYMKVMRDLTEQKRLEEQLQKTASELADNDRRKNEFLALLAHELRNPLAPIRAAAELIGTVKDQPELVEEARSTIVRQTGQLVALVDDLLDISRITRGKLRLRKLPVAVSEIIRCALELCTALIDGRNHKLTVQLPDEPIVINADPTRVAQIISNLLNNAAKFTPQGGHIQLSVAREGDQVAVVVEDSGIGIREDMLDKIFDLFAQADQSQQDPHAGLGIGLTLVRSMVELHGGSVEARSKGIDQGSVFTVRLPIAENASLEDTRQIERKPLREIAAARKRRVLVADDNAAAARMLGILISQFGHEVQTAADGQEAVNVAADFRPDVIFLDIGMPNMNGYEAARAIRQHPQARDATLVALTGWGTEDDKQRAKDAGFDHHLVKPAEPDQLKSLLGVAPDSD